MSLLDRMSILALTGILALSTHALAAKRINHGDTTLVTQPILTKIATYDVQRVIDKAIAMNPAAGQAIQAARDNDEIGFVEFSLPGYYGVHDYNTVGLNPAYGTTMMAVALLHEWTHIQHSAGPTGGGGHGGDDRVTDPCYACVHMQMGADSWTLYSQWICDLEVQGTGDMPFEKLCLERRRVFELVLALHVQCAAANCTGYPTLSQLADWSSPCANCP